MVVENMIKKRYESYKCSCKKGDIQITKNGFGKVRSNKRKINHSKSIYTGIKVCRECGSTIDVDGRDLKKLL
jgi:hypothetical protein